MLIGVLDFKDKSTDVRVFTLIFKKKQSLDKRWIAEKKEEIAGRRKRWKYSEEKNDREPKKKNDVEEFSDRREDN